YSAFNYYTGFKVNSGEYKVMGLAPYGEPKYVDVILRELIDLRDDGSFTLNQKYFNYLTGLTMTNGAFDALFGGPPREPESKLTQREMDLARSVQVVCEEIMLRMCRTVHRETRMENLCLAGGVALNCVANGRILREGPFKGLWIQPAHASPDESEDQVPRRVPAVRAQCAARTGGRLLRARLRLPVHAARRPREAGAPDPDERRARAAVGNRQAQRAALGYSGGYAH